MNIRQVVLGVFVTCAVGGSAMAQEVKQYAPADGEMVKLEISRLWKLTYLPNAPISNVEEITNDLKNPSISPDGSKVILFDRDVEGIDNKLVKWQADDRSVKTILGNEEASIYVTWDNNEEISVRRPDKPFFHDGQMLKFRLQKKSATLRARKPLTENRFVAYDNDDVIILVRNDTKTLQAISDTQADRYYAPMLSPDEKYVVFSGLTTGVHVFDIEANAVVYIGSHGTDPSFSPDGRYLIYTNTRDDGHQLTSGDLVVLDLHKHAYRYVANPNKEIRLNGTLSEDGRFVAYETLDGKVFRANLLK